MNAFAHLRSSAGLYQLRSNVIDRLLDSLDRYELSEDEADSAFRQYNTGGVNHVSNI